MFCSSVHLSRTRCRKISLSLGDPEERRRMIKMDFRKQFSLPSQLLSGKDKLAHGKDVTDIVTTKMMDFGKSISWLVDLVSIYADEPGVFQASPLLGDLGAWLALSGVLYVASVAVGVVGEGEAVVE